MAEVLFYHLTERTLEATAPDLLEKCLARGWRAVVRLGSPERLAALDSRLWTFRDDAFLPHGTPADPHPDRQPVYLTCGAETPNAPQFLMLAAGAEVRLDDLAAHERTALIFDGSDPADLGAARAAWKAVAAAGLRAVYWAEDAGRWVRRAETGA